MFNILCLTAFAQQDTTAPPQIKMHKHKADSAKKYCCPMHKDAINNKPGKCPLCGTDMVLSKKEQMKMEVMKIYTCPMHADQKGKKPGKCPKCGMQMTKRKT
jgi:predicted RNA-binding Zn-ribbon protein involved in translation (DUF1610 family)